MTGKQEPTWKKMVAIIGAFCTVVATTLGVVTYFSQPGLPDISPPVSWEIQRPQLSPEQEDALRRLTERETASLDRDELYKRAYAHSMLKEYDRVPSLADEMIRVDPRFVGAYVVKGMTMLDLGRYSEAEEWLRTAVNFDEKDQGVRFFLARAYQMNSRWGDADRVLKTLLSEKPEPILEAAVRNARGSGLIAMEQPQGALAELDRSLELLDTLPIQVPASDQLARIQQQRARAFAKLKRPTQALEALKAAEPHLHNDAGLLANQGLVLLLIGRAAEALPYLINANELAPRTAHILYNLACAYSRVERGTEALEALSRALELDEGLRNDARADGDFDFLRSNHAERMQEITANTFPSR